MTAEIIPFPGLIERVANRMLRVMEASPGEQRDDAFGRATTELGVGLENGLDLSAEQWKSIWRRVDLLMSERRRSDG